MYAQFLAFAAFLCAAPTWSAVAEPISASRADLVLSACKLFPPQDTALPTFTAFMVGQCAGVVEGVAQLGCPPGDATLGQKIRAIVAYVEARPARSQEQLHL
jgi:hypothetical protein